MSLTFFEPPKISHISPTHGETTGGYFVTVYGSNFRDFEGPCGVYTLFPHDCLVCVWTQGDFEEVVLAEFNSTSQIRCMVPPGVGTLHLSISLNQQDLFGNVKFTYAKSGGVSNWVISTIISLVVIGVITATVVVFFIKTRDRNTSTFI
eukprot:TRINITY_DN5648_c0_g1_i1.p1 TRINITY_DN5648_c0_g1~~TRINITY_DN5648_c0_g1_i1.p1  ORF type:complete len:162 (+),score=29.05 TRINITY_DN5648_c0_g1_i1:42-488(+)